MPELINVKRFYIEKAGEKSVDTESLRHSKLDIPKANIGAIVEPGTLERGLGKSTMGIPSRKTSPDRYCDHCGRLKYGPYKLYNYCECNR